MRRSIWLVAKLRLERFGLTQAALAQNPKVGDIVKGNTFLSSRFSAAVAADLDVRTLCDEDIEIAALVTQACKENRENNYGHLIMAFCEGRIFSSAKSTGRNFYISARGYCGVGPDGDGSPGNNHSAIQVRDIIAILATAPAPVILRRIDEHHFSLVGLTHVPQVLQDPHFKRGMSSNFHKFLIREVNLESEKFECQL
jgi:hypothetical protein